MDFDQFVQDDSLRINAKGTVVDIERLVSFLQNNTDIKKLSLVDLDIGDEGVRALANGNLLNLTSLHLIGNEIDYKGVKALANGNLTKLTSLNLRGSKIGAEGAKALSEALKDGKLQNLTSLDLGWNEIGAEGVKALSEALKDGKLQNLTSLDLEWNEKISKEKQKDSNVGKWAIVKSTLSGISTAKHSTTLQASSK
nr:hypothetical protein [Rickettsia endosymbiont of Ceutorhynchus assimilis]